MAKKDSGQQRLIEEESHFKTVCFLQSRLQCELRIEVGLFDFTFWA
ncbi:MAG: hypothetical protein IT219_00690 [Bacteroidales bacterium]|nr:hypothetical protein [Bacteroidales bacterium]